MNAWWILGFAAAFAVVVVVAVLLSMIIATARDIQGGAAVIWARGQPVANNTQQYQDEGAPGRRGWC